MPSVFTILEQLSFLQGWTSVYLLLLLSLIILTTKDWRLSILALLFHYLLSFFLFIEFLPVRLAIVTLITGLFISLILYFTGRQIPPENHTPHIPEHPFSQSALIHFVFTLLILLVLLFVGQQYPLPTIIEPVRATIFLLLGAALFNIFVRWHSWSNTISLFLLLNGIQLFYHQFNQSTTSFLSFSALTFATAIGASIWLQLKKSPTRG